MFIAQVMTMGDMSPAGLSHAFYNSADGEPEDIVVDCIGFYASEDELKANIHDDVADYERRMGMSLEDGGAWIEIVEEKD